jgi:hypothetical protein
MIREVRAGGQETGARRAEDQNMRDDDERDTATGGLETPPDAADDGNADDGNPDAAAGVGARSGYGIDTGEENEGYPNASPSSDTAHPDKDSASAGHPADAGTSR